MARGGTLPLFDALIRRLARRVEDQGAHLLIVQIPYGAPSDLDRKREEGVGKVVHATTIPTLALRHAFDEAKTAGEELYLSDAHWNADGHRVAAEAIRAELLSRGWLGGQIGVANPE